MSNNEQPSEVDRLNVDHLNLRKYIGILGISLPAILIAGNALVIEPSISHYYYTDMSVVFTSVLFAFGLVLFAYKGYPLEGSEVFSDNFITNFAAICAIIVVVIPTAGSEENQGVPNWHMSHTLDFIHLSSAGIFMFLMGYMAYIQFAKENRKITQAEHPLPEDEIKQIERRVAIYKLCGIMVWVSIAFLLVVVLTDFQITFFDILLGETVALIFFGIAWLIKSKSLKSIGI